MMWWIWAQELGADIISTPSGLGWRNTGIRTWIP
jgi:hypothetical protein